MPTFYQHNLDNGLCATTQLSQLNFVRNNLLKKFILLGNLRPFHEFSPKSETLKDGVGSRDGNSPVEIFPIPRGIFPEESGLVGSLTMKTMIRFDPGMIAN